MLDQFLDSIALAMDCIVTPDGFFRVKRKMIRENTSSNKFILGPTVELDTGM